MWNFANLACVVFISAMYYIVGIEFLFSFHSRQQDEGENSRAQSNPPGRCFSTVVDFFLYIHVVWFVIEMLNVDVL